MFWKKPCSFPRSIVSGRIRWRCLQEPYGLDRAPSEENLFPELEEGDFAVDTRVLTGSNLSTTIQATQQTARVLLDNFPEVKEGCHEDWFRRNPDRSHADRGQPT
jgi:hypothetical protein